MRHKTTQFTASILLALFSSAAPSAARASDAGLDAPSKEALGMVQQLLQEPAQREKAIGASGNAQLVDAQVKSLTGNPAFQEAIYSLSSEIFEDLVKNSNGDPLAMQKILEKAKNDPKAFYNSLSEKHRKTLQELARKIEASPGTQKKLRK